MKGMLKKIKASSPYIFQLYTTKKHTPLFYCYSDFLFIPTNFQMSEADMEKGDDVQILSAEFSLKLLIIEDYLL